MDLREDSTAKRRDSPPLKSTICVARQVVALGLHLGRDDVLAHLSLSGLQRRAVTLRITTPVSTPHFALTISSFARIHHHVYVETVTVGDNY